MIALILLPLVMVFAFSSVFEAEIERIAEENGLDGFDPDDPSIYDDFDPKFGTNGAETLVGTNGDDALFALGQKDVVFARDGDDLVEAGSNNDTVFGAGGSDIIGGGTGADVLHGHAGNDAVLGNAGDDFIKGDAGNDFLVGGGGTDTLLGGKGDDFLISGNAEVGEFGEIDLSATGLALIRAYADGKFDDVDFETLDAEGAFNGVDPSFLTEEPQASRGGDIRGGAGNDLLVLNGGDTAEGGSGEDRFVLDEDMVDENTARITDYEESDDTLVVTYKGDDAPVIETRDRGDGALIMIGPDILAFVEGARGLDASAVELVKLEPISI